ncbi:MAG: ubiquitin carboxyl-terminal hydrolase family protein [bacterium]
MFVFFLSIVPAQAGIFDFVLNPFKDAKIGHWLAGDYAVNIDDADGAVDSCGLNNLGNTCYMNALLQNLYRAWGPLAYNDNLMAVLHDHGFVDFREARCKISKRRAERECVLLVELFNLFRCMSETDRLVMRPKKFLDAFFSVVEVSNVLRGDFERGGQSDSQQLFEYLADIFSDFLEYAQKTSIYNIGLVSCGRCLVCNNSFRDVQKVQSPNLLVEIGSSTLDGCLDLFFQENFFGIKGNQDNRAFCAACSVNQAGTRKVELQSINQFLHIQLNRFRSNNTGHVVSKITNQVSLPEILDVKKFISQDSKIKTEYRLVGIIFHAGTAKGGHYFAAVKNKTDNNWVLYNDSEVTVLDMEQVACMLASGQLSAGVWQGQAYLLCYENLG